MSVPPSIGNSGTGLSTCTAFLSIGLSSYLSCFISLSCSLFISYFYGILLLSSAYYSISSRSLLLSVAPDKGVEKGIDDEIWREYELDVIPFEYDVPFEWLDVISFYLLSFALLILSSMSL